MREVADVRLASASSRLVCNSAPRRASRARLASRLETRAASDSPMDCRALWASTAAERPPDVRSTSTRLGGAPPV